MRNVVLAYAFLKAAYTEGIRNPVDAITPMIKRALMGWKGSEVDATVLQKRISDTFGIVIPINVIRYTFPRLVREGVLRLENYIYQLASEKFEDDDVRRLEQVSREKYNRLSGQLRHVLLTHNMEELDHRTILEEWLDTSALSFLGGDAPAFGADNNDRNVNKAVYFAIRDDKSGRFLDDLTDIAWGDCIYRAIKSATEYDAADLENLDVQSKMSEVVAYFDTRFVIRALGIGMPQFTKAATELMGLAASTGCKLAVFQHTIEELKAIVSIVASRMSYTSDVSGDFAAWAVERGFDEGDLLDWGADVENAVSKLGFRVEHAPPIVKALSVDERTLDDQLKMDLQQTSDKARVADVNSLTAIYRLRDGQPHKYLEGCKAIFITPNKGLADSSVRFFQKHFREEGQANHVQICMTDVVFSSRLWTKIPTMAVSVPRDSIVAHSIGNLRPTEKLKESFLRKLKEFSAEGTIDVRHEVRVRLSRFVEMALATEFDTGQTELSTQQALHALKEIIRLQKQAELNIRSQAAESERANIRAQIKEQTAVVEFLEQGGVDLKSQLDEVYQESTRRKTRIEELERFERSAASVIGWCVRWVWRILVMLLVALIGLVLLKHFDILAPLTTYFEVPVTDGVKDGISNFVLAVCTILGVLGWSLGNTGQRVEGAIVNKALKIIMPLR